MNDTKRGETALSQEPSEVPVVPNASTTADRTRARYERPIVEQLGNIDDFVLGVTGKHNDGRESVGF